MELDDNPALRLMVVWIPVLNWDPMQSGWMGLATLSLPASFGTLVRDRVDMDYPLEGPCWGAWFREVILIGVSYSQEKQYFYLNIGFLFPGATVSWKL